MFDAGIHYHPHHLNNVCDIILLDQQLSRETDNVFVELGI